MMSPRISGLVGSVGGDVLLPQGHREAAANVIGKQQWFCFEHVPETSHLKMMASTLMFADP